MNFRRKEQELPAFQFTAMMDVVFLLLCFFITTSVFSQWEMEVDVKLPTATSSKLPVRMPGEVIINIARDGRITINQRTYTRDELLSRLSNIAVNYPGQPVVVRADKQTPYERLMEVIDVCRLSDIWNISFATSSEEKDASEGN